MDFIISLAHFCEVHGPTSVLCTQISQGACATCHPCDTPPADDNPKSSYFASSPYDSALPSLSSPFETPPTSPKSPKNSPNPYFPSLRDSAVGSFASHLGDVDDYCENCTFLVPKNVSERLPDGAPGSPAKGGKGHNGSPVLRTSQSIMARGCVTSSDDANSDSSEDQSQASTSFSRSPPSLAPSSPTSPSFAPRNAHTHTLTYLTTRQPISPTAYSLLKRTCIRTLSCEVLPRGSSGPIYFGDPVVGYTVAYVFRIPDPRARGRMRTYALIAMGGRDSWRVSMAMVKITEVFEQIATQIVNMANAVIERETLASPPATGLVTPPLSTSSGSSVFGRSSVNTNKSVGSMKFPPAAAASPSPPTARNITPVSSFLTAKKVDPDGYPRVSRDVMRAKGLAEIVGNEKFFVELHARFCMLLASLVKEFGTGL